MSSKVAASSVVSIGKRAMDGQVIVMILNQSFLPDQRVRQQYDVLKEAGYRVVVVASLKGSDLEGYEIVRIDPHAGLSSKYNTFLWRNPKLAREIVRELDAIGVVDVHAVHVHDLFWCFLGVQLKNQFGAKLVVDLHENYPALIDDLSKERAGRSLKAYAKVILRSVINPWNGPVWVLIRESFISPRRLKRYELAMLKVCDNFIVVVDEALERFRSEPFHGKGVVVSNTKDPLLWSYEPARSLKGKLVLVYMGTVQDLRGLDSAILAMRYLDQDRFELNIVGVVKGSAVHRKFVDLLKQHSIRNVNLVEWLADENEAFDYIEQAHVCIVPHRDTALTQSTVPHKLFMYMAKGRPVLVSDVGPLKRIVASARSGLVFEADNPEDFAEKDTKYFERIGSTTVFAKRQEGCGRSVQLEV